MGPFWLNPNIRRTLLQGAGAMQRRFWSPSPRGRFKMNTDGACRPNSGPSGYGGILRNDGGEWVRGFHGFIGVADSLTAEIHGILKGLKLLDKLGLKGSILESDSQPAFWSEDGPGKTQIVRHCWELITECRLLAFRNDISFKRIDGGDANQCADKLADMGMEKRVKYVELKDAPDEIKITTEKDKRDVN